LISYSFYLSLLKNLGLGEGGKKTTD
jgi:hypothetical protein